MLLCLNIDLCSYKYYCIKNKRAVIEMSKRELLLRKIKENNGILTTKEALNIGIHKDILKELTIK